MSPVSLQTIYRLNNSPDTGRLEGRTILITGAASGIGRCCALSCADQGAMVLILDKNENALNTIYDEILELGGTEPIQIVDDLGTLDEGRCEMLAGQIETEFGSLHGILHLAGETSPLAPMEHLPLKTWSRVIHTQVNAPWILTRTMQPLLEAASGACVVFSSGEAARTPRAYWGAMGVSWGAMDAMAGIWNEECEERKVRFYSVNPGNVNTPMRRRLYPGDDPTKLPAAEEIGDAYVFLLSTESSDIRDCKLEINDGVLTTTQ